MRLGVLTGGGDCPGLNAVIRAVVRKGERHFGDELIGFRDGWKGVLDDDTVALSVERLRGTLPRGGTVLGTSRVNPFTVPDGVERCKEVLREQQIDAVVSIGGEGTLGVTRDMHREGVNVIGVPKTIDNDILGTDLTFGFHTAVQIATDAIDRLHTTAESHDRVILCEVMGRHAGWIATFAGIVGGAAAILIPEVPFDLGELAESLMRRHEAGRYASIVVVAEGARPKEGTLAMPPEEYDAYGHVRLGGISTLIGPELEISTGFETRVTILGHVQRGGSPNAFDRVLATRYGVAAIDGVHDGAFGQMVALRGSDIVRVSIEETGGLKTVPPELYYGVAGAFFA